MDESRNTVEDSLLDEFLLVASRAIDNYCQRDFSDYDETPTNRIFRLTQDFRQTSSWSGYGRGISGYGYGRNITGGNGRAATDDFAPPTADDPVTIQVAQYPIENDNYWCDVDSDRWWVEPLSPVDEPAWSVNIIGAGGNKFVRVNARWGWGPVTPQPVSRATIMLASRLFRRQDSPLGVTAAGEMGMIIVKRDMDIFDLLKPYRSFERKLP